MIEKIGQFLDRLILPKETKNLMKITRILESMNDLVAKVQLHQISETKFTGEILNLKDELKIIDTKDHNKKKQLTDQRLNFYFGYYMNKGKSSITSKTSKKNIT